MTRPLTKRDAEALKLFQHRNRLLTSIREHSLLDPEEQSYACIFQRCCEILTDAFHCDGVWAGDIDKEKGSLIVFASSPPNPEADSSTRNSLAQLLTQRFGENLQSFTAPLLLQLDENDYPGTDSCGLHCMVWPVGYQQRIYGFVVMHCREQINICELKNEFICHVIDDIALALFSQDTALKLKVERDFNKEIIDSIQALMVSISPCGTIVSFNKRAEQITGYKEQEILEKYWVDVMISPRRRLEFQQLFSETLRGPQININFTAPLLTKDGTERFISWHGSIRHNIDQGKVGIVMLGIDETKNLAADQQLNMFTARWEKIFIAIQDPALVVSNDYQILEANPATCAAAKKRRTEVIGKNICDILHGGHSSGNQCPVEQLIGHQQTRISETELHGLHGTYMLTVSPLVEENGDINATLLVARNLTAEEVLRAESIRAAQLAAIGELASGVAHEINNPINGIINYAQIILDAPEDPEATDHLRNIISEGKRIAGIISKLLDFARRREEILAPSAIKKIITNSLQLVEHLLKKDGIICSVDLADPLPSLMCNEQQLQQVMLNLISNARFALNAKYPKPCPEKRLEIKGVLHQQRDSQYIRLTFTDYGVGIEPEILDRLFDPFFSTKPKGEGTGLGLSISHGLVRDHGGYIRVQSKLGEWTRFIIDLPIPADKGT
ncbi:PAS domain S-box protein [Desulfopila sp. IMCC35006]|uniref:PAS domain-containing sensor histidine kinase n=1 Tax=Desulfopila sp. IMCC35006 TaxID=2569542 RepID=UPI0010AB8922|nr:PAS domain S-box protein [Desulfopila sp. IMCC35006]TKB24489.1 PAS domain S-box protein [Desulfopila sp. IMCC35006]